MEITREEYNKINAVNFSLLKLYMKSPAHFNWEWMHGQDSDDADKESKALRMGKAIHCFILEPEKFEDNYVFINFEDRPIKVGKTGSVADYRTKENKLWREDMLNHYRGMGQNVLNSKEEFDEIVAMGTSIKENKAAGLLLKDCSNEEFIEWTDSDTGVKCKAIVDFYNTNKQIHGDLKSMEDASPSAIGSYMAKWGTHVQLAFYADGLSAVHGKTFDTAFIIAIEKKPPFVTQAYFVDENDIALGRSIYKSLLAMHVRCLDKKAWGGYDTQYETHHGVIVAKLPTWAHNKAENDEKYQNN